MQSVSATSDNLSPGTSFLLALNRSTSSSRSIVFDAFGRFVAQALRESRQIYLQTEWVDHDPNEIWNTQQVTVRGAQALVRLEVGDIAAIGIANRREGTMLWNPPYSSDKIACQSIDRPRDTTLDCRKAAAHLLPLVAGTDAAE